ncbi:MAG: M23 family metallopeptidase, partial [Candidatus Limnocylindria bacterium]|nr:M23 family metallopeptidase [Candidatus Limnocylindria bacterium]
GQRVCVQHAALIETCYFHLGPTLVTPGERVVRAQPIALVGLTGDTTGPHVHWEARLAGRVVDPLTR